MKKYTYKWLHVPTGTGGIKTIDCDSIVEFSDTIHKWNIQGAGIWQYKAWITV